jgi:glycerol-3-phosphate acyltransferase PlsY
MPEITAAFILRLAACYLIGSIPFAALAMQGTGIDILKAGSGNPGFNNVLRFSKWRAAVTLLGDFGKGTLSIWMAARPGDGIPALWAYGLAAIVGHCYTPWLGFNGGKGVATSAGVMVYLYPSYAVPVVAVYAILRVTLGKLKLIEAGTIASLTAYAVFVVVLFLREDRQSAFFGLAFLLFVAWRHKRNFENLFAARGAE